MIRWKVCRKDWHLSGKRPQIGLYRKVFNLYKVSSFFYVCLSFTKQVNYKVSSKAKNYALFLSPNNPHWQSHWSRKISLAIRHIRQEDINLLLTKTTAARSSQELNCNDQPLFVDEYKFKVRWQSSPLQNRFSGFRRTKHKHLFSQIKPYSTTS